MPSAVQAICCAQTASSTQSPSASIRPLCSATGMNSPGEIVPRCGSSQRSSASSATRLFVRSAKIGW
jgi:hypothetical protein